ncbi:flagellar hook-length control protein FliK [Dissulfurirhabdus thermomarina]|uniref:Flagellar hook-length control protein FliK n=1 Tax=Dissulfurirhabdus thermomarina TaxID=1765737 RepID=A0A6N9TMA6_DISTH|nr:flagellar hook-length control protein FliK [Dissulfurirhabdus thermomarina]NDY42259.1 flagellar hook-length control protein FliK [Dissulfurirhabdus thermomarina]NMX22764.1 flagellar hook-length control protein FliK [Dissulfurirhabdus thermomarina]
MSSGAPGRAERDPASQLLLHYALGLQSFHQDVRQVLDFPLWVLPFWFSHGQGWGQCVYWREEGGDTGKEPEPGGAASHMVFDLHLAALGEVRIQVTLRGRDLAFSLAAAPEVLPAVRAGVAALRETFVRLGYRPEIDVLALRDIDRAAVLGPFVPPESEGTLHVVT